MNRLSLLPLAATALLATAPMALAEARIAGDYHAYGRNADGSAYSGTVNILENADRTFTVNWSVGSSYTGTGVLNGDILIVNGVPSIRPSTS